jgi:hypothetical protein
MDPADLNPHPDNFRRHGDNQRHALEAVIAEVGWAGVVLFNETTGNILDGHLRKELFEGKGRVPVLVGQWSAETERKILATLDPIGALAHEDPVALDALLKEIGDTMAAPASKKMLADMQSGNDLELLKLASHVEEVADEQYGATVADDSEVTYKTFMTPLTVDQERTVRQAIALAKERGNLQSSGDALDLIAREYLNANQD